MIESLFLAYDMRRLNDVTWFRKCWYNTSLVEALFIGSTIPGDDLFFANQLLDSPTKLSPSSVLEDATGMFSLSMDQYKTFVCVLWTQHYDTFLMGCYDVT